MSERARRTVTWIHIAATAILIPCVAVAWHHEPVFGIYLLICAAALASNASPVLGVPWPGPEQQVKGLQLTGMTEERARAETSRSAIVLAAVQAGTIAFASLCVVAVANGWAPPSDLMTAFLAHTWIFMVGMGALFTILPYAVIAGMLRKHKAGIADTRKMPEGP